MKSGDLRRRSDNGFCFIVRLYDGLDWHGLPERKADVILDGNIVSMPATVLKYTTWAVKRGAR
jgi:hypothetical protein